MIFLLPLLLPNCKATGDILLLLQIAAAYFPAGSLAFYLNSCKTSSEILQFSSYFSLECAATRVLLRAGAEFRQLGVGEN